MKTITSKTNMPKTASQTSVTISSIAGYCLVSRSTVLRWIKDGKLSSLRLPSGHYRVTAEDFSNFLKRYNIPIKEELFASKPGRKEKV